jgi:hypothetical protein
VLSLLQAPNLDEEVVGALCNMYLFDMWDALAN